MTFFKYIFAILLTIPMVVLGRFLFIEYTDLITGTRKKQLEKKRKHKRENEKGFTIHIPDSIEKPEEYEYKK